MSDVPIIYGRDPRYVADPSKLLAAGKKRGGVKAAAQAGVSAGDGSEYIKFVKKYHKAHPELTWKQAMKKASKSYHKLDCGKSPADYIAGEKAGDVVPPYIRDMKEERSDVINAIKSDVAQGGSILGSIGDAIGSIFGLGEEAGVSASAYAGKKKHSKKKKAGKEEAGIVAGNILGDIGRAVGSIFGLGEEAGMSAGMMDPRLMRPELIVAAMDHAVMDKALKGGILSAGEAKYAKKRQADIKKMFMM